MNGGMALRITGRLGFLPGLPIKFPVVSRGNLGLTCNL